nr:immunoglobulin light chain junction region [Macaca mulatta]
CQQESTWPTC